MSLKCFIVLVLILRYLIYSELSFACEVIAVDIKNFNSKHGETWRTDEKTIFRMGDGLDASQDHMNNVLACNFLSD